jgi:acyl-CoA thioesterase
MTGTADDIARNCAHALWRDDTASRALGMTLVAVRAGHAIMSMTVRDDMVNGHGTCHGGYMFTLADSAFAYACNSYDERAVAQHCSVTFIAPAKRGDILTAEAREVSRTGRSGIYDVTITGAQGKRIAEFRGHSRTIGGAIINGEA